MVPDNKADCSYT